MQYVYTYDNISTGQAKKGDLNMTEYQYHGYTIKKEHLTDRFQLGFAWSVYKDGKLIGWDYKEKVAQEIADWDAQYSR